MIDPLCLSSCVDKNQKRHEISTCYDAGHLMVSHLSDKPNKSSLGSDPNAYVPHDRPQELVLHLKLTY